MSFSDFQIQSLSQYIWGSKNTQMSEIYYTKKIIEAAKSDAKSDVESNSKKNWQNSKEFYSLKDEYISSGSDTASGSFCTYSISNKKISSIDTMNKAFQNSMQQALNRTIREGQFYAKYNYAYKAYKDFYKAYPEAMVDENA
ncbi:MAG: hypothetical protein N2171_08155 [Clostridia bacterium]|nr:hypothetical protein [Clostridia bacterium]